MRDHIVCGYCSNLVFLDDNKQYYHGHKVDCTFYEEEKARRESHS